MAKTRNRTHSEVESLRGYVRELEKSVRSLQKQLRQYEKYEQRTQDVEVDTSSEDTFIEKKLTMECVSCGKGKMVETLNLDSRGVFGHCSHCEYRGRMK